MEKLLNKLSFLRGSWSGEGFVIDFTEPVYNMMFGSMQKANEVGEVVHWETYRFEERDNHVFLYPSQMGEESGVYVMTQSDSTDTGFVFEAFINKQTPIQAIYFQPIDSNNGELLFGLKGEMEGRTFEKEWSLHRRTASFHIG
ncbi:MULTISPECIES: hypothetical protein [Bacillaceae]|uniref:DUF1579 domain-containing protein n=1 Tax=Evansella alkalicola TaxID=745819 RepID=A0ABS6JT12_9BACI|nr:MULTISPECIES: hypothetical protein [Bacillaceae]MBU9721699.1 hypothetical protein [Bacillus alkalicola]